ncbi:MAG TPA: 6-phosphogluconolactonase [Chitinophagaceae bacterium]|nr:6-phosphogluconolactonase [Chitinophagaceae bacterium]
MKLNIYDSKEKLSEEMTSWMCDLINSTLQDQEFFTLALSGGETPQMLYKKLASEEYKEKITWKRVHIFWGDERVIPFDDDRNNAKMAFKNLINQIIIPPAQVHKMRVDIEPLFAAKDYENVLQTYFGNTEKSFDLILLGVGDDGHTLSLFPGSLVVDEKQHWVNAVYNEKQKMYRITLMPSIVNKASHIAFMVTGENKSEILYRIIEGQYEPNVLPAQLIKPENGELHWFLDKVAAEKLNK